MKQILQNLKTGKTELAEVPSPQGRDGHLMIASRCSLVSAGTERMLVEFGKAGWIEKIRQQPDKVRQVIEKVKTDGLLPTMEAVKSKLDQPMVLGYCNVGNCIEVSSGGGRELGRKIQMGDRVVSNGPHAEVVCVPRNLCARVPEGVSDEEAVFAVIGAVGLQGLRLANPTIGECFVVTGLGLIGLITVQLLKANGCRVLGIDFDSRKCALAREFGAETVDLSQGEDSLAVAQTFSQGQGVDGVLITASTKSNEPVHQAAVMCRKRGRIVLVGVTGLELSRDDFYKKELSFQVSCSYGPGRYDPAYEEKGQDYPLGYVRWTEQRNLEAILDLMTDGRLDVKPLISHRFPIEEAEKAYELLGSKKPYLGIILEYGKNSERGRGGEKKLEGQIVREGERESAFIENTIQLVKRKPEKESLLTTYSSPLTSSSSPITPVIGFIGAGNYAGRVLIPALQKTGTRLKTIASNGGVSGTHFGKKYGFEVSTTDLKLILEDMEINTVFIATRHNNHAALVCRALEAGKHVFVEKPLCLTLGELSEIVKLRDGEIVRKENKVGDSPSHPQSIHSSLLTTNHLPVLMVGFNRRFAPQTQKIKSLLDTIQEPKSLIMTVNAGLIPMDHWTQDEMVGGGRIIGEACHFVDLMRFLVGSQIVSRKIERMKGVAGDTVTINLTFAEGSIGSIHYFANGHKAISKERLEIFCAGRVLQLDNFRRLKGFGWHGFSSMNLWRQDKGQQTCTAAFVEAVREGKTSPIPFEEIVEVSRVILELAGR